MSRNFILGLSAYFHDSAAALLCDGKIIAAAQEERFTRKKNDASFPVNAIRYCLNQAGIDIFDLECVVYYEKPIAKFARILDAYRSSSPSGFSSFTKIMPIWIKHKLDLQQTIRTELEELTSNRFSEMPDILFTTHHQSHAGAAFYPSPFERAAVLCLDGVGEYTTTSAWLGNHNKLKPLFEMQFPHSLGLLYSAFTYYCGFRVNSGEYKLMGLAPYGEPKYVDLILDKLIDLKDDGTFQVNLSYFDYIVGDHMINQKFEQLFEQPAREPETHITTHYADVAASIQIVLEQIVLKLVQTLHKETNVENLCLGGGVALNCVANSKILQSGPFKNIWIQPAAGDAGNALGSALVAWHQHFDNDRITTNKEDKMQGAYLGPSFNAKHIEEILLSFNASYEKYSDKEIAIKTAKILSENYVVGWFQGRMEFGPRALGNRSILGNPTNCEMQKKLNLKIKFRESFRPFAPAALAESAQDYFDLQGSSPYMLLTAPVKKEIRCPLDKKLTGLEQLSQIRSIIPAVTHIDYSARIQTVHESTNPKFHKLISEFRDLTGIPIIINTSFNVRGEPIVCTPEDAFHCFMRTDMDYLVIENFILDKTKQTNVEKSNHTTHLEVD